MPPGHLCQVQGGHLAKALFSLESNFAPQIRDEMTLRASCRRRNSGQPLEDNKGERHMQRLLVDQQVITNIQMQDIAPVPLAKGQVRLRLDSFALTANNVTYAASGFAIGYWKFFPTGIMGQGQLPVWGTGEVIESQSDDAPIGTRLYGFYPAAETLVVTPRTTRSGTVEDRAAHRADLPAVYNRYIPITHSTPAQDHLRALLQPLLATSWLLADWLRDNACFGARQIIIGSASSKTGLGLCKFLAEDDAREVKIIGLTSETNKGFVEQFGACDAVLTYDEISNISQTPSVYVDMAGNSAVKHALHGHLAAELKHSAAVGISHWDKFAPKQDLPGVKPQFFFAPAQIAKRRTDWGPGVVEREITQAWQRLGETAGDWLDVTVHEGLEAMQDVYASLASGQANPRQGHIITL